jgi:hypothetical protein
MRRAVPNLPVSPNMLRHFAVLTLVITGGLAMFAGGENQSFLAEQVKQRQMKTEAVRAERQKATEHTVVIDGLRVAPGTRLGPANVENDSSPPANVLPAPPPLSDFPMKGGVTPSRMGPDMPTNAKTVPPPAMTMRTRPKPAGKPGQLQPGASQARTSEEDVNAIIQASAQRGASNRPNGD